MRPPKKKVHIFIISDSTGMTAEMVISAVLVQFKDIKPVFSKFPYIKTQEQIKAILVQAHAAKGIVIYSLVSRRGHLLCNGYRGTQARMRQPCPVA